MLKLIKTDITRMIEQRIFRMQLDTRLLQAMTAAEIKAIYPQLEWIRDAISKLLDRADGK